MAVVTRRRSYPAWHVLLMGILLLLLGGLSGAVCARGLWEAALWNNAGAVETTGTVVSIHTITVSTGLGSSRSDRDSYQDVHRIAYTDGSGRTHTARHITSKWNYAEPSPFPVGTVVAVEYVRRWPSHARLAGYDRKHERGGTGAAVLGFLFLTPLGVIAIVLGVRDWRAARRDRVANAAQANAPLTAPDARAGR